MLHASPNFDALATPRAPDSHLTRPPTNNQSRKRRPKPVLLCPAYKRYLIAVPPPVLVIHLKRFQQLSKTPVMSFSHGFKKLDDYISFPEYLDLTPFLAPKKEDFGLGKHANAIGLPASGRDPKKCVYRLYAVVVHIGNMLGGHYVAYTALPPKPQADDSISEKDSAKSSTSEKSSEKPSVTPPRQWAYISDHTVRLATLEDVLKSKAYLCMYERS
ncbi:hypothetical protein ONZ45_g8417 [Pleurotus djamor]|nr:hypothetical protein ONZ45_g8417 [Pleurotus djamor]